MEANRGAQQTRIKSLLGKAIERIKTNECKWHKSFKITKENVSMCFFAHLNSNVNILALCESHSINK